MAKEKKQKSLIALESMQAHVNFLRSAKMPYKLIVSNYTVEIKSELLNVQYLYSMRSNQCFAAYMKIKKDLKNKPIPEIDKSTLYYYDHDLKNNISLESVFAIDITNAYATQLFNNLLISAETFAYISKIKKDDRLAAVGMLASNKHEFEYNKDGTLINYRHIINELENFFYLCVRNVAHVMGDLKKIASKNYLFTWVDCLYVQPDRELLKQIEGHLQSINIFYTVEMLFKFNVRIRESGKINVSFWKKKRTKEGYPYYKFTYINIPQKNTILANDIINYLTKKGNNEKISKVRPAGSAG